MANNGLEIAIISGMAAVIVAFITVGALYVFRLFNRVDRLAEQLAETTVSLSEKINQSHLELSEKINQSHLELSEKIDKSRDDVLWRMEQMKAEIISALVSHTHPEPGGGPVFTAPSDSVAAEPQPTPADD